MNNEHATGEGGAGGAGGGGGANETIRDRKDKRNGSKRIMTVVVSNQFIHKQKRLETKPKIGRYKKTEQNELRLAWNCQRSRGSYSAYEVQHLANEKL